MKRYDVARFPVAHELLEEGDRVEISGVGIIQDGVIVLRAATVRGPAEREHFETQSEWRADPPNDPALERA